MEKVSNDKNDTKYIDPWVHGGKKMRCKSCIYFVPKGGDTSELGRCRRHAPTISGFPVMYTSDWCGDHKVNE